MSSPIAVKTAPAVPLRGGAIFPGSVTTIAVSRKRSLKAAQAAQGQDGSILILIQRDPDVDEPTADDVSPVGILAVVRDVLKAPQQGMQMIVDLRRRVRLGTVLKTDPYLLATYTELSEAADGRDAALMAEAIAFIEEYAHTMGEVGRHTLSSLRSKPTTGKLADYAAGVLPIPLDVALTLLETADGEERLQRLIEYLRTEIQIADIRSRIQQDARDGAEKAQRDYLLREQLKAIRRELGEEGENLYDDLRARIASVGMPEHARERALKELKRLERQGEQAAEAPIIRTYLEWLTELPWDALTPDNLDVDHVRRVLDTDHHGLADIKERIVEFVAVRKLAGSQMRGAILNLTGPPGVGKTSIASSVARAMGRKLVRISLGGVNDEAEIRGHRRTYIGAMPGRLLRALRDVQTRNPVIVLDEVDKLSKDWRGDPAAALLEVLDPEQNREFTDHYLELPFDLSQAIFITTSNTTSTIPPALLDRMETLQMAGYIEDEKLAIAEGYLVRKQLAAHGLADRPIRLASDTLRLIIRHYTYEAGVRQLERHIGSVVRKVAVAVARGEDRPFDIQPGDVTGWLGPQQYEFGRAETADEVGVVTGLAVMGHGSDILVVEVRLSTGSGKLVLTGSLGKVMRESAQAARTYAHTNAAALGLSPHLFETTDIHIHVPAGAQPKEGPSAGIALATAIVSAFTNRPVRRDVAMTGEVTLRGRVLPIGGLKAKAIAAHRAGIKTLLFPRDNEKDLPELPEQVRADLLLAPVAQMEDVLAWALRPSADVTSANIPTTEDAAMPPVAPPLPGHRPSAGRPTA